MAIESIARGSGIPNSGITMTGLGRTEPNCGYVATFEGSRTALNTLMNGSLDGASDDMIDLGWPSEGAIENMSLRGNGDGSATLTVTGKDFGGLTDITDLLIKTTFRVSMVETQFELKDHPTITENDAALREVLLWLATDEKLRIKREGSYHYVDDEDEEQEVSEDEAVAFCNSYMHGITTFVRYYPVIEKISHYRKPPGMQADTAQGILGNYTGGSLSQFSDDIGTYSSPPIQLNGYQTGGWFKSGDEWVENADHTWNRTERWTYTPDGSGGVHGWIYGSTEEDDE